MKRWLITMGDYETAQCRVMEIQWNGRRLDANPLLEYTPVDERKVDGKGFTGARLIGNILIVCGFNSIYRCNLENRHVAPWIVRNDFNDLHDIDLEFDGGLIRAIYVANTGHDCVDHLDTTGSLISRRALRPAVGALQANPEDPYFDDAANDLPIYRRKLRDQVHPNAVRRIDGCLWISRFADRSAMCLKPESERFVHLEGCPHDLVPEGDVIWMTTTDGRIWYFPRWGLQTSPVLFCDTFDLTGLSGWCRGLYVDKDHIVVGFTRMVRMPTDRWCNRPTGETFSGLLILDRHTAKPCGVLPLDRTGSHPKIFAVLEVP